MKKKILTFIMALCLMVPAVFALVGCGNANAEYVGKYVVSEYSYAGYEDPFDGLIPGDTITKDEYESNPEEYSHLDISGWFSKELTLNANGTFNDYQTDVSFGVNGTWSVNNNNIILKIDGEEYMILAINEDNSLTQNQYESYSVTFTKN